MSSSISFVFKSAPSISSDTDAMTPVAPPPSPASGIIPNLQTPFILDFLPVTKQSYSNWTELEAAEPSTKKSRFNWSEMDYSNGEYTFAELTTNHENPQASITD